MKKNFKLAIIIIFLTTINFSCKESQSFQELKPSKIKTDNYEVKNGMLAFKSQESFDLFTSKLKEKKDFFNEFTKLNLFTSMKKAISNITEAENLEILNSGELGKYSEILKVTTQEGESIIEPMVRDEIFSSLLNQKGLIQIGNEIIYINKSNINFANLNQLNNEQLTNILKKPGDYNWDKSTKIVETIIPMKMKLISKNGKLLGGGADYTHEGVKQRFRSFVNYSNWLVYISAGIVVTHERKNTFSWGNSDCPYQKLISDVEWYEGGIGPIYNTVNQERIGWGNCIVAYISQTVGASLNVTNYLGYSWNTGRNGVAYNFQIYY